MQTFLPYASFGRSAAVLDRQRLGKQRVEAKQILQCLRGEGSTSWQNHPAVKMWRGHEIALAQYGYNICFEWINRGYKDSLLPFFADAMESGLPGDGVLPSWLGDPSFHASHRSNLLRKNPRWYRQFGWSEGPDLPYIWPAQSTESPLGGDPDKPLPLPSGSSS